MAAAFTAFFAVLRREFPAVAVLHQSIQSLVHLENNIAATSSITAVRAARRHIFFPAKADMAVAAAA